MSHADPTPTELSLSDLWNEVLQRSRPIQRHEGFFDLGGDSISVLMMLMRVSQNFGVDLSPDVMFENPSLAAVAAEIERNLEGGRRSATTGTL